MCGGRTEERARDTESEIQTAWTEPKATRMEGGFTFIALPLGLMFFLSGLIINVFQVRHSYTQKPFPSWHTSLLLSVSPVLFSGEHSALLLTFWLQSLLRLVMPV